MKWLRSVRARIGAAVFAFLLVLVGSQGYLLIQQQAIARALALNTRGYLPLVKIVGRLDQNRERAEREVGRLTRGEARPGTATVIFNEDLQRDIGEGRIHTKYARTLAYSTEERAYLNRVDGQLSEIEDAFREWQRLSTDYADLVARDSAEEAAPLKRPLARQGAQLADEVETLTRLVDERFSRLTRDTEQAQARTSAAAAVFTAFATLVGFLLIALTSYALAPIGRLTAQVKRLAAGDVGNRVEVSGSDEIADLAIEFNTMTDALQARDAALQDRAEQLNRLSRYLTSVLDNLNDALFVVEDGKITLSNPQAVQRWHALVGSPMPERFSESSSEIDSDGRKFDARRSDFGSAGAVWTVADITEQSRTRDKLARSERLALIGQMLAQVTHEVRNPLNALSLNTELLSEEIERLDPERRSEVWELLETISGEIERLTNVTAHYLQLARRPAAQFALEPVRPLIEDVLRFLALEFDKDGVELQTTLADVGWQWVDTGQLRQALLNLLRNSREAGASRIIVQLDVSAAGWFVRIEDNGVGISSEDILRAGEPFYSSKASGTGLGLAITKQILEDHDGYLQIEASVPHGTVVTLHFGHPTSRAMAPEKPTSNEVLS